MRRRTAVAAAPVVAVPPTVRLRAQTRARRVGALNPFPDPGQPPPGATEAWRRVGWIVGESLLVERRYAAWRVERMPEMVDDLLNRQHVELLITVGPEAAGAAARATRSVPIVFTFAYLPVECGLIESYARPGRNCTGLAQFHDHTVLFDKRVEILRWAAPNARRLFVCGVDSAPFTLTGAPLPFKSEFDAATRAHGFEYRVQVARRLEDVESVLTEAAASGAEAVMIGGAQYLAAVRQVAEFALHRRWITSTFVQELLDAGLLMYQGPTGAELVYLISRPVQIADRILRGASPAEIPVELPTRYELALNLKAARKIGVTLPQALVLRADRVIE